MANTSNINIRLDSELKRQAELVLEKLEIPVSSAIKIFLKQVVLQRAIPFEVTLQTKKPVGLGSLSKAEIDVELEKGYAEYLTGDTEAFKSIVAELREDYGI
jgi:addiction module antitoxin, RelB/DinJ family